MSAAGDAAPIPTAVATALNHVELVYGPGERELAVRVLRLFGCTVSDSGGRYLSATIDPASNDANNVLYASERTEAQGSLERLLSEDPLIDEAVAAYRAGCRREPQTSFHFGIRYRNEDAFHKRIDAVRTAADTDPDLQGRVSVSGVYRPNEPGSFTDRMVQAFLWTDIVASGLLSIGQHVELQLWTGDDGASTRL